MPCFGEPYHLHVCPKCQEVWECPDDLQNICRVKHTCGAIGTRQPFPRRRPPTSPTPEVAGAFNSSAEQEDFDLWEILVPEADNAKVPFSEEHHEAFRRILRGIRGNDGTTCNATALGYWLDKKTGEVYTEKMIPVRFRACRADAERMSEHARKYYKQVAIMAYRVASAGDIILAA
ncbi:MAG: hypothetical protein ABSE82_09315 [Nitrososphaerales archaeon]|jgi:hypothetical protein